MVSSGVQFVFWLLITVSQIVCFQTVIRKRYFISLGELVVEMVYLTLVVVVLLTNCRADVSPKSIDGSEVCITNKY